LKQGCYYLVLTTRGNLTQKFSSEDDVTDYYNPSYNRFKTDETLLGVTLLPKMYNRCVVIYIFEGHNIKTGNINFCVKWVTYGNIFIRFCSTQIQDVSPRINFNHLYKSLQITRFYLWFFCKRLLFLDFHTSNLTLSRWSDRQLKPTRKFCVIKTLHFSFLWFLWKQ
jgi:hypothetical protein